MCPFLGTENLVNTRKNACASGGGGLGQCQRFYSALREKGASRDDGGDSGRCFARARERFVVVDSRSGETAHGSLCWYVCMYVCMCV